MQPSLRPDPDEGATAADFALGPTAKVDGGSGVLGPVRPAKSHICGGGAGSMLNMQQGQAT